jgi:hypothetical protein
VLEAVEAILQGKRSKNADKIDRLSIQIGEKLNPEEILAFLEKDVEEDERVAYF